MMRKILTGIALLMIFVVQITVMDAFEINDVIPNILIITIVIYILISWDSYAVVAAIVFGALTDVMFCDFFGVNTIIYTAITVFFIAQKKKFFGINILLALIMVSVGTFAYQIIYFLLSPVVWVNNSFFTIMASYALPQTLYNTIFMIPVYLVAKRFTQSFNQLI